MIQTLRREPKGYTSRPHFLVVGERGAWRNRRWCSHGVCRHLHGAVPVWSLLSLPFHAVTMRLSTSSLILAAVCGCFCCVWIFLCGDGDCLRQWCVVDEIGFFLIVVAAVLRVFAADSRLSSWTMLGVLLVQRRGQ